MNPLPHQTPQETIMKFNRFVYSVTSTGLFRLPVPVYHRIRRQVQA